MLFRIGHLVTSWVGIGRPTTGKVVTMGLLTFGGYKRRLDALEYRAKRHDVPQDAARLLELVRELELDDRIILDRMDSVSY